MNFKISILLFLLFHINTTVMDAQTKPTLIYIGDPMCSWCYGFSPELTVALTELGDAITVELVMGGLRPYNTETMQDLGGFLQTHWQDVQERSGQTFNYEVLKKDWVYDTEPPSRALIAMSRLAPEQGLAFFKAIQTAFYVHNVNTNLTETYVKLAEKFGVDSSQFKTLFESDELKRAVRADFEKAGAMGVRGFPSLVLKKGENYHLIANGYTSAEKVVRQVWEILRK